MKDIDIIKEFKVSSCLRKEIQAVIEENHYSKSINGIISDECFSLSYQGKIIGGAIYGKMAMANQWKKYSDTEEGLLELRRLALVDEAPKNSESFFIGKTLRMLRQLGYKTIVSYADQNYGHSGIIYRATNFQYKGLTASGRVILFNGKKYHDKAIRTKYNGVLKPFAVKIKEALENGDAFYIKTKPKHIFTFTL